ncbi:GDP-mannose 4,6 dehydratase [Geodermatophilus sp. Leaf369]|uniref:GDP-mannose 4,6-dehydratase n=1 Tax=Geodermatophilus sp. Leaf369 TaxID=1736354 RepID=UPI0006FEB6F3|nr:GDP-mannose 4,6-dehydratase [Geodermatophilus sp. Leaf369]KQS58075.1 GDP-mannose 4,6 dehydratase [Geodermatophilus sp. Leaf369]
MTRTRVLLTGATGQDGSYLVEQLLAEGAEVHALVREGEAAASALPDGVHAHVGDLTRGQDLEQLIANVEPTEVYNLGGLSSVALSWAEPSLTAQVTGVAVGHLLKGALDLQERSGHSVRFVQASSAEVFGWADELPQTEGTPIRPVTPYGAAKAYAHHLVGVYRLRGLHATSCILYNHESPRRPEAFVTRKITAGVARIAVGRQTELSMGNLDARRDWGWAPDYVDAMVRAARHESPGDYVVATGVAHSVRDFVAAAFEAAGIEDWEPLVTLDPRFARPSDAPEQLGDASRARLELGWSPTVDFAEVVSRMVAHDMELVRAT